ETGAITFDQSGGFGLTVTSASTQEGSISISNVAGDLVATAATSGAAAGSAVSNITLTTITSGNISFNVLSATGDTVTVTSAGSISESVVEAIEAVDITAGT